LVTFQDAAVMTADDQNDSADQNFMATQEQIDQESNYLQLGTDDKYDAQSKVIKNLAPGVADTDAATKLQVTSLTAAAVTAAEAAQAAAEAAQTAAETAQTAAELAETNAAASEAAAAADAATVAADKAIVAADKATVAADKATVAADKATVNTDKGIVAADKATVAADKAIVAADKATVNTDKGIVAADKATVAADKATVAADKATTLTYKNAAETAKTAAETAQTAAETAQTAAETAKTNAETAETNAETAEANAQVWAQGLFDPSPDTDHTSEGFKADGLTAGETLTLFQLVYRKSDGKLWKADANGTLTYPCVMLANGAITADTTGEFLIQGFARDDSWTWTVGGLLYLSDVAGSMTQTAPSASGDKVQVVGVALTATVILFKPDFAYAEIA
jgi:hypothetical protein